MRSLLNRLVDRGAFEFGVEKLGGSWLMIPLGQWQPKSSQCIVVKSFAALCLAFAHLFIDPGIASEFLFQIYLVLVIVSHLFLVLFILQFLTSLSFLCSEVHQASRMGFLAL